MHTSHVSHHLMHALPRVSHLQYVHNLPSFHIVHVSCLHPIPRPVQLSARQHVAAMSQSTLVHGSSLLLAQERLTPAMEPTLSNAALQGLLEQMIDHGCTPEVVNAINHAFDAVGGSKSIDM